MTNNKGSMYTLEASIAIIMMVTALALFLRSPAESEDMSKANYKLDIYNALKISDEVGDLRRDAIEDDADSIESELSGYLTGAFDFDVTIYNTTDNRTSEPSLDEEDIITVSYFLSGWLGNYNPREVRVFAWGVD